MSKTSMGFLADFYRLSGGDSVLRMQRTKPGKVRIRREARGGPLQRFKVAVVSLLRPSKNAQINRQFIGLMEQSFGSDFARQAAKLAGISNRRPLTGYRVRKAIHFLEKQGLTADFSQVVARKSIHENDRDFRAMHRQLQGILRSVEGDSQDPKGIDRYRLTDQRDEAEVVQAFQELAEGFVPIGQKLVGVRDHLERAKARVRSLNEQRSGSPRVKGIQGQIDRAQSELADVQRSASYYEAAFDEYGRQVEEIASSLDSRQAAPADRAAAENFRRIGRWFSGPTLLNAPRNFVLSMKDGRIQGRLVFRVSRGREGLQAKVLEEIKNQITNPRNESSRGRWVDPSKTTHNVSELFHKDLPRGQYSLVDPESGEKVPIFPAGVDRDTPATQKGIERFEDFFKGDGEASFLLSRLMTQDTGIAFRATMLRERGIKPAASLGRDPHESLLLLSDSSASDDLSGRDYTIRRMDDGGYEARMRNKENIRGLSSSGLSIFPIDPKNSLMTFDITLRVNPEDIAKGEFQVTDFLAQGNLHFDAGD